MDIPNFTEFSDEELDQARRAVINEQERRQSLERIPAMVGDLSSKYLSADGKASGDEWTQPQGAFDAYPIGWRVTSDGKEWESLVAGNVWEPPTNWREVTEEGAPPPEWVQPSGSEDAYSTGDEVSFGGLVYRSLIDANTWSPADYAEGWEQVTS